MKPLLLTFLLFAAPVWAQNPVVVRVLDAAGAPLPNALVKVQTWGQGDKLIPEAATDANGTATFSLPVKPDAKKPVGRIVVAARGFGFAGAPLAGENLELRLEKGATWRGKVLDEAGKPVEGAVVSVSGVKPDGDWEGAVWLIGEKIPALYTAKSGADGSFQIEDVPATMGLTYGVKHPRFAVAVGRDVAASREEIIKLVPGGGIRGRVLDVEGKPLPKTEVWAMPVPRDEGGNRAVTDENGNFNLESLAAGQFRVGAQVPDDAKFVLPQSQMVTVATGKISDVSDLRAVTGVEIRGIVREAATQKPLAGAGMIAQQTNDTSAYNTSDAAGRFTLRVVPGNYKVYVSGVPTGYLRPTAQQSVEVGEAAPREVVFELQKTATIRGVMVDEAGKPFAARLKVDHFEEIISDADGKWEYTLRSSEALRMGGGEDETGYFEVVSPDKIETSERGPVTVKVRKLAWNTVSGRVVAPDGAPLEGVQVSATFYVPLGGGVSTSATRTATSDAQGRFVLPKIREGRGLKINGKKAGLAFQSGGEVTKTGANWTASDLVFAALDRTIEGTTAPGARVVAAGREVVADGGGKFRFEGLPSGDVMVFAAKDGQFGAQLNAAERIELRKQELQGVDEALAREIWREVVGDAQGKDFYALDWVRMRLAAGGDGFEARLQNARTANNRDMAFLAALEKWDGKTGVPALIGAAEEIKAPDIRLYAFLSAAQKSEDKVLGARALEEAETVLDTAAKEAWWREMNLYRAAVVAEKFEGEKAGSLALNRAIAYTLKNHGEKSVSTGRQNQIGRDEMFRIQAPVVAQGSPALLRQLFEAIEPGSGYDIWARAEAIPVVAKTHGAEAALPFLDELEKMPEPAQGGERQISAMKPESAFGTAVRPVIEIMGRTSPDAALALARRVKSDYHRAQALANAARFQTGETAAKLWREAVEGARAEQAPRFASQAWEIDPKLGAELFEIARLRIEGESKNEWMDDRLWPTFAFYYARVDAAGARLILEREWGQAIERKTQGQTLQAFARAMTPIDGRRAWEMARQIPVEDKNFWSLEARRKIGQYLAASEEQRRDFPFDRWGATDTWSPGDEDW